MPLRAGSGVGGRHVSLRDVGPTGGGARGGGPPGCGSVVPCGRAGPRGRAGKTDTTPLTARL
eukprot:7309916-Prymnesium_polylepis.1